MPEPLDFDVVVVGFGPVGQTAAALLGRAGHRVGVFERFRGLFPLPRAIRLDGEAMRVFADLGIAAEVRRDAQVVTHYPWYGADGELIVDIDLVDDYSAGFPGNWVFYQPHAEAALEGVAVAQRSVTVARGWAATGLTQTGDDVTLTVQEVSPDGSAASDPRTVTAQYVIGADGANSFVREACGIQWADLGFAEHWLVCDVRPSDMSEFAHLPTVAQYCDPRRPRVEAQNGVHHRRWEFMLLEGEDPEAYTSDPGLTWTLLQGHFDPAQGELIRHAVYEFRSLLAQTMRGGRALLAGDAAHLMPPFMGEGMCSGLRDANNLAWRLDLVLRGLASPGLLDSYSSERHHQNEAAVRISIMMGQVSCTLDPAAARDRDAAFRSGQAPPPPPVPGLGAGLLHQPAEGPPDPVAGNLAVRGVVTRNGVTGRFDDVIGYGFALICAEGDPRALLGEEATQFLDSLGARLATLQPGLPDSVVDADGTLTAWLAERGVVAVLARPDAYAFGGVHAIAQLPTLVESLRTQIT